MFVAAYLPYFFTVAGVNNPMGIAQGAYAIQLVGNMVSWFLVDRLGRRPLIVWGMAATTVLLFVIGCVAIPANNQQALSAMVALMAFWGFLYQATLGAVSFAVGGETPTARLRQKTYSINIMSSTAAGTLVSQLLPYLINPTDGNLGGKVAFVFFGLSMPLAIYFFFCLPEMKGRTYLELEEMFQQEIPARKFKEYVSTAQLAESEARKAVVVPRDQRNRNEIWAALTTSQ
ncbi:Major facilitator-type transporter ecdC like protein [Verticillium longisporum]|uniref:Major facilitator-type transporter ecdC like protein n=1 Tax=Verticillium longisporum TaxID=100787 RepID=A0A8I3AV08_VERLO|nr:Major facilitator-type transporter ecdC like protein [Verticillium longisporum]KAG7139015.1 Major facilitator-type transporter ecdC like protein [Verticillium longisporum]